MVQVVYERCCGVDIHKQLVVACLLVPGPDKEPRREVRSFGTMTDELLQLADWLAAAACTHVAMETAPRGAWLQRSNGRKGGEQAPVDPGMAPTTPEASPVGRR